MALGRRGPLSEPRRHEFSHLQIMTANIFQKVIDEAPTEWPTVPRFVVSHERKVGIQNKEKLNLEIIFPRVMEKNDIPVGPS